MRYYKGLDALRAVSVLLVIAHHFGIESANAGLGVQIFFVISGFLITSLLLGEADRGPIDLKAFYQRRAARILPAFFAYACVVIAYPA